ncbi:MAG: GH92 family glycosyl hydrolase [Bacteroidetes bacterium]|nr:GH92 family glycosyl hydrolase [Bacteroidota bacterium]MBS1755918.1 GH92 family glycosyl hydrolase [Bacteroidota bacterium]
MKVLFFISLFFGSLHSFAQLQRTIPLVQYVKPIIGTQRMGHTYPGATVPFGMVQLSPDTDTIPYEINGKYNPDVYKYCSGYQYDDNTIVGFSHTHFSGTGHSDLGDILIMPTVGAVKLNPGTADNPNSGFRSPYSHDNETVQAGYYKVLLNKGNITAELTATTRVGFHQYTFPKSNQSHIILDLVSGIYNYDGKNIWTVVHIINDSTLTGYRQTNGWARNRTVYFAIKFSKAFFQYGCKDFAKSYYNGFWGKFNQQKNFPDIAGRQIRMNFDFKTEDLEKIKVKVALSSVSMDGALKNMQAELPGWDFEKTRYDAQQAWDKELNKITIDGSRIEKENFYTAMYHAMINPTVYMDVDGSYKGLDQGVHTASGFTNYTTFSLWDTYRALHPLFTIIEPKKDIDMIKSMLAHYDQSPLHMLPIWSNSANDNWCMSGYHSVAVIADALIKNNVSGIDANKALDACVATARHRSYEDIGLYLDKGYIPVDKNPVGTSTTLEYAYDDWAIAQLAKKINRTDVYNEFIKRSQNYKNVFDTTLGFMHSKNSDGKFTKNFNPLSTNGQGFIEGNSWNYTLFVPQYPHQLINLMGGNKKFIAYLDTLFTMNLPESFFAETEDITREGIIGGYVHGNEPSHHVAYLYNYAGATYKTQERVRMILNMQYHNSPDGLGGNDDTGQMSAWYIFSSLGFYPVAPGSAVYAIGSPAVDGAVIHLDNNKSFIIEVKNQDDQNVYIQKIELNGKPLTGFELKHADIMKGGKLTFYMGDKPVK